MAVGHTRGPHPSPLVYIQTHLSGSFYFLICFANNPELKTIHMSIFKNRVFYFFN